MSLKKTLVVKSNQLILASYSLNVVEQRLILMAIVTARETTAHVTAETLLKVRADDYARHFKVSRQTAYQALTEAAETLFNRRVKLDVFDPDRGAVRPLSVRWLTGVDYEVGEGTIVVRFGLEIIPHITDLEANFTSYELKQVAGLTSAYAIRLYELLIKWRVKTKTPVTPLEEFREQIGLLDHEYRRMGDFKKNVLDLAVQQINLLTDIDVSYEQHKNGRNITGFSFTLRADHLDAKLVKPDKAAAKRKTVDALSDYWDRLHGLELAECQKINPVLCRADIETIAKALNISALQAMQQIRSQAKQKTNTLALES